MEIGIPGQHNHGQHDELPEAHNEIKVDFFAIVGPEVRPIIANILGRRFIEDQFVGAANFLDRLFLDLWADEEQRAERLQWLADERRQQDGTR